MSSPARIPVDRIHPNPQQPRQNFNEAALQELAENIRTQGLIQPIKIMPHPERPGEWSEWMLVDDGERRLRAMWDVLGWTAVEVGHHVVIVKNPDLTATDRLARALAANLQRQDLNPIEAAQALQKLHDLGLSDAEIARRLGKSRAWVTNRRRLLQLPPEIQEMVATGELPERKARALLTWLGNSPGPHPSSPLLDRRAPTGGAVAPERQRTKHPLAIGPRLPRSGRQTPSGPMPHLPVPFP